MANQSPKAPSRTRRKPRQARSLERVNRILDVAEKLFIEQGYDATTTKAIAAQAEVPIGSLYQFFPDKAAILQALAERYTDLLIQRFVAFHTPEIAQLSLTEYVDRSIEEVEQFFLDYPGYYAIFMNVQVTMPALEKATDTQLIQTWATLLPHRDASLQVEDYEAIAFVLVKAIGNLLWFSLEEPPEFRQRIVSETKRVTLHYLQSYFPAVSSNESA